MKLLSLLLLGTLALSACKKRPSGEISSVYASLPELPVAPDAPEIDPASYHAIQIQHTQHGWRVHGEVASRDQADSEDQIRQ